MRKLFNTNSCFDILPRAVSYTSITLRKLEFCTESICPPKEKQSAWYSLCGKRLKLWTTQWTSFHSASPKILRHHAKISRLLCSITWSIIFLAFLLVFLFIIYKNSQYLSYDKMLIDWVRSGRHENFWLSVMPYGPRAYVMTSSQIFSRPVGPNSVNKYIWELINILP